METAYRAAVPLLHELLPEFEVREHHSVVLPVPPEEALRIALAAPVVPDRIVWLLFRLRGLPRGPRSIEEFATTAPFAELGRSGTEFVAGLSPGALRIAFDLRAEPGTGGSVLSTETRVHAFTPRARRAFRLYWLVVGPFSALIRRRWLKAVAARAQA